ncbi:ClpP class membrane-bound serine protease [Candidatus Hakubella thermalkaliphila]|uniref:ClpP class membrane-bound serine protease n=1 Tax=Candidatus Hakubella thermalkaliphila TaxID=2754717 RepID=A0A6V8P5W2_9ACTN|nr:nodulation protein NfeD [Candidatus Hakubella thermalkaliphila]GFP24620.1 ClpP class membrane-bound serine protease [Candidatus Hakubella thermalkaliphila]GFP27340.1 ClpP class membrane-bound serine protease [Candidatus Hakubella thermalkaliphila]GFP34241.1 ClpP class membrane-bound serine protease [Candidatus Hakubella thermalkaliphila]
MDNSDGITIMKKKSLLLAFLIALVMVALPSFSAAESRPVQVIQVEGVINPPVYMFISEAIDRAEREGAQALIIQLDTPGGLDTSMRSIIREILDSQIPIVVYVYPDGSRATSAGVFITMAAHVAAMAPATSIGAAHPVALQGEISDEMKQKIVNDAVAYIRNLAEKRGRNAAWAEEAVRESSSLTASQAVEKEVIDYVAKDYPDLLAQLDGRKVVLDGREIVLSTKGAEVTPREMSFRLRLLHILSDPNIAYLLLMIGIYGIIYEFANPGLGFAGIAGVISIILALYSLHTLPVNIAGLALIVLAIILFIADIIAATGGILTAGGIASMLLGSLILIDSPAPYLRIAPGLIIGTALTTAGFFTFAVRAVYKAHKEKSTTGIEGMLGQIGVARTEVNPRGQVSVRGELWSAEALDGHKIEKHSRIIVQSMKGLVLRVKKYEEGGAPAKDRGGSDKS